MIKGLGLGACQQICGDALWDARFLLPLSVLRSRPSVGPRPQLPPVQAVRTQRRPARRVAAAQLNFHRRLSKQQSAAKRLGDHFPVLHKSRIPERPSARRQPPFISPEAHSCQEIRATLRCSVTFVCIGEYEACAHPHTHSDKHTHINTHPQPHCRAFACYITVSGSGSSSEC